jgi:hypothetical protein
VDASSPSRRRPRLGFVGVAAALVVALAAFLAGCDGGSSGSQSESTSKPPSAAERAALSAQSVTTELAGPEAAIAGYLSGQGIEYVGDCADAQLPRDTGTWCSTAAGHDDAASTRTYDLGPVGGKAKKQLTLKARGTAVLTPGHEVGVADGDVGQPQELTREDLQSDIWITGNLLLDQAVGIGNGLTDLPAGVAEPGTGGGGRTGTPAAAPVAPPSIVGDSQYPAQGSLVVENPTAQVGAEVAFRGSGCSANGVLQITFDGQAVGTIAADASGTFAGSISIPRGTSPGEHALSVRGSNCSFNTTVTVAASGLAFTGASGRTGTTVLVGIVAIVLGFVLVVGARRRRHVGGGRPSPPGAGA